MCARVNELSAPRRVSNLNTSGRLILFECESFSDESTASTPIQIAEIANKRLSLF